MKSQAAFCVFGACVGDGEREAAERRQAPAGPAGSGATARQSPIFDVAGSVSVR